MIKSPAALAQLFYDLFFEERLKERFKYVIFAVLGGGDNYSAFQNVFGSDIEDCGITEETPSGKPPYVESGFPFPICNHTAEVGKENLGYTQGIFADGTPFEAELWENHLGTRCLSIIIPEHEEFWHEGRAQPQDNVTAMYWTDERPADCSVLPIGMAIREQDIPRDVV